MHPIPTAACPMIDVRDLDPHDDAYATLAVERMLAAAIAARASDIHLSQRGGQLHVRLRIHGKLVEAGTFADGARSKVLSRIKALARLVTYRRHAPQEGRLVLADRGIDARVVTLPTVDGERAVIRLAARQAQAWTLDDLDLPPAASERLRSSLRLRSGVVLISGPAGSGKTTTAYALLRTLLHRNELRSIVTLEDPVEQVIEGIDQSQIDPEAGFGWTDGLRALLRQDPEVVFIGEVRDPATATALFQSALTGQLVISTMHARSAVDAVRRLLDFGVPGYHLVSGLEVLLCQRLLQRCCDCRRAAGICSSGTEPGGAEVSQPTENARQAQPGASPCPRCFDTGIDGRMVIAETLPRVEGPLARALGTDPSSRSLAEICRELKMQPLAELHAQAVAAGVALPQHDCENDS
ncbi:MAG: type II/IV secretion system protein [Planctomycetota bacterium]|nr:MAG: type II/IV secretion system protein [Planctomycetota bacterium]